jgi:hypothetical protein
LILAPPSPQPGCSIDCAAIPIAIDLGKSIIKNDYTNTQYTESIPKFCTVVCKSYT